MKMLNKRGQGNDFGEKILLLIIAFILAAVLIYFLGKVAIWLGVGSILFSLILFFIASQSNEDQIGYAGLFCLGLGIILLLGGLAITSFFENNEAGKTMLNSGKTVVNTTAETYRGVRGGLG